MKKWIHVRGVHIKMSVNPYLLWSICENKSNSKIFKFGSTSCPLKRNKKRNEIEITITAKPKPTHSSIPTFARWFYSGLTVWLAEIWFLIQSLLKGVRLSTVCTTRTRFNVMGLGAINSDITAVFWWFSHLMLVTSSVRRLYGWIR